MTSSDVTSDSTTDLRMNSRVLPLIAVAGAHGKTTVARILASMLQSEGLTVASWTTPGVYVDGERLSGEISAWQRVIRAARAGEVDVLIQELEARLTLAIGLPQHAYQLAIANNVCGPDAVCARSDSARLEQQSLEQLFFEALKPDAPIVANADDRMIMQMVAESTGVPHLFALHAGNPALRKHLAAGGSAVWVDDSWIFASNGNRVEPIAELSALRSTLGGALIPQLQNIMAAIAGARIFGVNLENIRRTAVDFGANGADQPGGLNITTLPNGANLIVDVPRQYWSLRLMLRGLRSLSPRRILIAVGGLSNLTDDELIDAGRLIGSTASAVLLHSQMMFERRHTLLRKGLSSAEYPPLVLPQADEPTAISVIKSRLTPDDLGVVLADLGS